MLVLEGDAIRQKGARRCRPYADVDGLRDLPRLENDTEALAEQNHPGRALTIVDKVQEDDGLHEHVCEDGADGDAHVVLLVFPVGLRMGLAEQSQHRESLPHVQYHF